MGVRETIIDQSPEDLLVEALHEYDRALRDGDLDWIAEAADKVHGLRAVVEGPMPLEPAPENAQANSAADLVQSLTPLERAALNGTEHQFVLNGGFSVSGTVTDVAPNIFTVDDGHNDWIIVRTAVQAIRLPVRGTGSQPTPEPPVPQTEEFRPNPSQLEFPLEPEAPPSTTSSTTAVSEEAPVATTHEESTRIHRETL